MKIDRRSMTVQLLLLGVILVIISVVVLTAFNLYQMNNEKNAFYSEKMQSSRTIGELSFQGVMDADQTAATNIARDQRVITALKNDDRVAAKALMDEFKRTYPNLDIISLASTSNVVIARSTTNSNGDVTTNEALLKAISGQTYIGVNMVSAAAIQSNNLQSAVAATKTTEGMSIVCALPVKDETGKTIGGVYAAELLNNKLDLAKAVGADTATEFTIFQGDTRITTTLKDASGNPMIGTKAAQEVIDQVFKGGKTREAPITINNIQYFSYYEPLKGPDGTTLGMMFYGYDMRSDIAEQNNALYFSIVIGLIVIIVAVVATYFVVKRITDPLNKLVKISDEVAGGNLDVQVETGARAGEVGALSESVKKMVGNTKERILYTESIVKGIQDTLIVVDEKSVITFINEPGAKMFRRTINEMKGTTFGSNFTILGAAQGESNLAKTLRTGEAISGFENHIRLHDGTEIWVRGSNAPIKDDKGRIAGVVEVFSDITKVKEFEESIKHAQAEAMEKAAYSDSVLRSIKACHLVIDTQAKFTYINDVAENYLGISAREVKGKAITDVVNLTNHKGSVIGVLKTGSDVVDIEDLMVPLRTNKQVPIRMDAAAMKDAGGKLVGVSIIARDITREKQAQDNLKAIVRTANEISGRMSEAAQHASSSMSQAMTSSKQISDSIQQIATGSQNQAQQVDNISMLVKSMSTESGKMTAEANASSTMLKDANNVTKQVAEAAKIAMGKMNDIKTTTDDSAKIVRDLGEKSKQIGQIVEVITSIASQTNLLALNAAIEAARAGEAGRGFAVVAEEVRKLAEESAKSTEQISSLIGQIKEQTNHAVASMDKGTSEVASGSEYVAKALKSIDQISTIVDKVANTSQNVANATEKQTKDMGEIVKSIEQISAVVEESASVTEEVSASAEESTATMEETANVASQVQTMAQELKSEVSKLKVE